MVAVMVAGSLTADGRAIVADDMHLGLRAPNLWFRARLRYADPQAPGGQVDVQGVSLPGLPGMGGGKKSRQTKQVKKKGKSGNPAKRAEQERARKAGDTLPVPVALRQKMRAALATAGSPLEYVQALEEAGVKVAPSFQRGTRNVVRGYKVALPGESYTTKNGQYVFASPSKLDSSLSWPNICARFEDKDFADTSFDVKRFLFRPEM